MTLQLLKTKFKAFGIHLGISTAIFIIMMAILLFWWYPGIWFSLDGGWQGTRIMVLVDLVLGPLMTFIIFNPGKTRRHIIFDLSVIATLQAAALVWGIHAVHSQRPLAIVFWNQAFFSVDQKSLDKTGVTVGELNSSGEELPILVYSKPAGSLDEEIGQILKELNEDVSPWEQVNRYLPLNENVAAVFSAGQEVQSSEKLEQAITRLTTRFPDTTADDYAFIPFYGRYKKSILIVDRKGSIIGHLE